MKAKSRPSSLARSNSRQQSSIHSQSQPRIQDRPSLLTGLSMSTTSSVDAEQIAVALRARLEFASLKAANGLTLHSLEEIEQATLDAERIEAALLAQQDHLISPSQGQHSADKNATESISQMTTTSSLPAAASSKTQPSNHKMWTSPSIVISRAAGTEPSLQQQNTVEGGISQPRTIFDAIAARGSSSSGKSTNTSSFLFPKLPLTSRRTQPTSTTSGQSPEAVKSTSSSPSVRTVVSAATLLHRAASIPQLGSPRRLVNARTELNDPHNNPSLQTKEQERKLAVEFGEQQRLAAEYEKAVLAQQLKAAAAASLKRRQPSSLYSIKEHDTLPPASKRARTSKQSISSQYGHSSWRSSDHLGLLAGRSPSSKLASSYARGVAASSAIGTGLARSPDTLHRYSNATANASSLAFQSPRGLTLGQGLGITSRNSLNSVAGSPFNPNPRRREESFERSAPSPAAPSRFTSELSRMYQGSHASASVRIGEATPSITPEQRTRPLLSPPPSSPAHREDTKVHRPIGAAPHRRAQDELARKKHAHFSPHLVGASSRRRQDGSTTSTPLRSALVPTEPRSPAMMQQLSRKSIHEVGTPLKASTPPSTNSTATQADQSSASSGTASQTNMGLGFDFEHGAPVDMPAPATPKKSNLRSLAPDDMDGKAQRTHSVERDVDMDGSEAAQLMLFLAGSPSAPSSTRFTAGVTPSITNMAFGSSVDGKEGQNSNMMRTEGRSRRSSDAVNTVMRRGRASGSPGPEGRMVTRMLTYGGSDPQHNDEIASLSPRSTSTASTPILGPCPTETSSGVSSDTVQTQGSEETHGDGHHESSKSPATTPELRTFVSHVSLDKSNDSARAETPPPHSSSTTKPVTPPRQPPSTPKAPGSSTFSYAEFLNVSPSPQPRLRCTPRIGTGKKMSRSSSGERPYGGDPSRTPSRMARGRFLDFDQELGLQSANLEHRKRFASMLQIGEEDDAGSSAGAAIGVSGSEHGAGRIDTPTSQGLLDGAFLAPPSSARPSYAGSASPALKEKSHNHSSGVLDSSAIPRTASASDSILGGLHASPLLKALIARPLAQPQSQSRDVALVQDGATEIASSGPDA
ncbi:hypothetical protein CF326_g1647 [Tilletia indica]|nr:hypothetical protein CF326_g1647 [Tilletia indica]